LAVFCFVRKKSTWRGRVVVQPLGPTSMCGHAANTVAFLGQQKINLIHLKNNIMMAVDVLFCLPLFAFFSLL